MINRKSNIRMLVISLLVTQLMVTELMVTELQAQTDFTQRIQNPGFETGDYTGWTWTGRSGGWTTVNADGDATKQGTYIAGYWNSSIADVECSQIIPDLPAGNYLLAALATVSSGRTTNQRLFAGSKSTLYGSSVHPAYSAANLAILSQSETLSFAGHAESTAENGPFLPLKVVVNHPGGNLSLGFRFSGKSTSRGFQFTHTTRADAGFFKFDHFTLHEVSAVASLDRIEISGAFLNQSFHPDNTSYTATVAADATTVTPLVFPSVEGVTISGTEPVNVSSGSGISTIRVTALNGTTQKTYTIQYEKLADNEDAQQNKLYTDQFPLSDVVLTDGPFLHAMNLNISHLKEYNVDRLLAPYRKEAGLPAKAESYPNWIGLDGHVGGHYLSAMAIHFAATGDTTCRRIMNYMVDELRACQQANSTSRPSWGSGYAGGVPSSATVWSNFKNNNLTAFNSAWVAWYNLHKTYAGLRDAWLYGNNATARQAFLDFCDWGIQITSAMTDAQMEAMLNTEHGGMNEIYADAYQMSGNAKYLTAAQRFSHKTILNSMAGKVDNLDNMHENTQVPKAVGFQRVGEVSGSGTYRQAAEFFWQTVSTKRSLSLGGNSRREYFPAASAFREMIQDIEGPESCNTHNMLKLTEHLFRLNPKSTYADYYERAMLNHILSTQHPEHGGYVYFTPARPQHYRVYSAPNQAMWCCVGTGMENHGKYGEFIYTHRDDSLYVNLFVASELNWKDKGVVIHQHTHFPEEEKTMLTISTVQPSTFTLKIRKPYWCAEGALKIKINNIAINPTKTGSGYLEISRTWNQGDSIAIDLPMHIRVETLPNVPDYVALMYGPVLLGAKTSTDDLSGLVADDGRWGHIANGPQRPLNTAPILVGNHAELTRGVVPVKDKALNFKFTNLLASSKDTALVLEPFYKIHDARYMMYWLNLTSEQYQNYLDSLSAAEQAGMALEARTIDRVSTGEQQPEVDHKMQTQNSFSGTHMNEYWRDARNGGFFSYELETGELKNLSLWVRYWGNENGSRRFTISVDGTVIATENLTGKWNKNEFMAVEYPIPASLTEGKKIITVRFQGVSSSDVAGGVFYLRLLKPAPVSAVEPLIPGASLTVLVNQGVLHIKGLQPKDRITVFDCSGRVVKTNTTRESECNIILPFRGVYVVQVHQKEGISRYKVWES